MSRIRDSRPKRQRRRRDFCPGTCFLGPRRRYKNRSLPRMRTGLKGAGRAHEKGFAPNTRSRRASVSGNVLKLSHLRIFRRLAAEVGLDSTSVEYCVRRVKAESSFLTKTLPLLWNSILRALETGHWDRPTNFLWKGRSLAHFRAGLLDRIVDPSTGRLHSQPCPKALKRLWQLCHYFYKVAYGFTQRELYEAEKKYVKIEQELSSENVDWSFAHHMRKNLSALYPDLANWDVSDIFKNAFPRSGPGTFYGSDKLDLPFYLWREQSSSIIGSHPSTMSGYEGYFKPYPAARTHFRSVRLDHAAEVLFVPKDSRGPRVISKEEFHALRVQLAFFDTFTEYLERVTHRRINFRDQSINRRLACESSITRKNATLDLKDASDRVRYSLVSYLFRYHSWMIKLLTSVRSRSVILPSGKRIPIRKLAGMGSGFTFPIMAFIIHLAVCTEIERRTALSLKEAARLVYVYGDDLIVPSWAYSYANEALEKAGLKVNLNKSFRNSKFRESCGGDYYDGESITPVRLKLTQFKLSSKMNCLVSGPGAFAGAVVAVERHCRELVKAGFHYLAEYYYDTLERHGIPLPYVGLESPVIGRLARTSADLVQCIPARVRVPVPKKVHFSAQDPYGYLGRFLRSEVKPFDPLSIESSAGEFGVISTPRAVKLATKRGVPVSYLGYMHA